MTNVISVREGPLAVFGESDGKAFVMVGENTLEAKRQANRAWIAAEATEALVEGLEGATDKIATALQPGASPADIAETSEKQFSTAAERAQVLAAWIDGIVQFAGDDPADRIVLERNELGGELLSFRRSDGALLAYMPYLASIAQGNRADTAYAGWGTQFVADMLRYDGGDPSDRIVVERNEMGGELLAIRKRDGMWLGAFQPSADQEAAFINGLLSYEYGGGDLDIIAATMTADGALVPIAAYRKSTGRHVAALEDTTIGPINAAFASDRARLQALEAGGGSESIAYVVAGHLRVIDVAGPRTLDEDPGKTWLSARAMGNSALGVFVGGGVEQLARVAVSTGNSWAAAEITIISSDGQSNGEAEAEELAAAVRTAYPYPGKLRMLATAGLNIWADQATTGGSSTELVANAVTGFTDLKGKLIDSSHGTTSVESAAYRYVERADIEAKWLPDVLVLNNCEGGQSIARLSQNAPAGYYGFANVVTKLTRIAALALAEGKRAVWRWMIMTQGESDVADLALGSKHDTYRSQVEVQAQATLGQTAPLRMLSWQMSSFYANSNGPRSILDYHRTLPAKFRCLGPSYPFPMSAALLHHSSISHDKMGEYAAMAIAEWSRTGDFKPLQMVSAARTAANEITVTMSEPVSLDTVNVPAKADYGLQVPGADIADINIAGAQIVITTSTAASAATSVDMALDGHVMANGRTAATQARSNIRSTAAYGAYRDTSTIYKFACHQRIAL